MAKGHSDISPTSVGCEPLCEVLKQLSMTGMRPFPGDGEVVEEKEDEKAGWSRSPVLTKAAAIKV